MGREQISQTWTIGLLHFRPIKRIFKNMRLFNQQNQLQMRMRLPKYLKILFFENAIQVIDDLFYMQHKVQYY